MQRGKHKNSKKKFHSKLLKKNTLEINENDICLPFAFDLAWENLCFINSAEDMTPVRNFLKNTKIAGLDTETKPAFQNSSPRNPVALLQIAARLPSGLEKVFVLDLITLLPRYTSVIDEILLPLLSSPDIIKLGQGLAQDVRELHASYPASKCFETLCGCLETNALHRVLHPNIKHDVGLKALCHQYLHCNLVKAQQCSDWSKRPLSESQLHYSACDALVLLRLYDAVLIEIEDQFPSFEVGQLLSSYDGTWVNRNECKHCGRFFSSPSFLQKHLKGRCSFSKPSSPDAQNNTNQTCNHKNKKRKVAETLACINTLDLPFF